MSVWDFAWVASSADVCAGCLPAAVDDGDDDGGTVAANITPARSWPP
jgi:hypothetical protein